MFSRLSIHRWRTPLNLTSLSSSTLSTVQTPLPLLSTSKTDGNLKKNFPRSQQVRHFFGATKGALTGYGVSWALELLHCCTAKVDLEAFFNEFELEDSYFSWFLVSELHLWMLSVRLSNVDGGPEIRNLIIENFWENCTQRAKTIAPTLSFSKRQEQIQDLSEEFKAAMIQYDAGLLGSDVDLAEVVWARIFQRTKNPDFAKLDLMVSYIRRTISTLDHTDLSVVKGKREVEWIPLAEVKKTLDASVSRM